MIKESQKEVVGSWLIHYNERKEGNRKKNKERNGGDYIEVIPHLNVFHLGLMDWILNEVDCALRVAVPSWRGMVKSALG